MAAVSSPAWMTYQQPGKTVPFTLKDQAGAWSVNAFVAAGQQPSPTLVVLGAVHGDEYEGPMTIARLLGALDLTQLVGTVVAIPVVNQLAYAAGTRQSPLDDGNLARLFPGDPAGSASARLADTIATQIIAGANALIDLHSAGVAYEMATVVGYYASGDAIGARSETLARAFGAPVLWHHAELAAGRTLSTAYSLGIPAIYTETAGGGAAPEPIIALFQAGIQRVMVALGQLPDSASEAPSSCIEWSGSGNTDQAVAATTTGLFRPFVRVEQVVAAGEILGEICGYDGALLEQITATQAGIVAMVRRVPRVAAGDGLYLLTQAKE